MRLFCYILNQTEYLDTILTEFAHNGISGATIIDSTGMARVLSHKHDEEELPFLASLRKLLNPDRENNNIILTVIKDEQLPLAVDIIEKIVGNLEDNNKGIVFSFPLDYTKGIVDNGK
ncbi:MAG: hypothetical protein GX757_01965 [Clostridiales bacterium]|nr:hypothetical protein [Clostridiales bacterium]